MSATSSAQRVSQYAVIWTKLKRDKFVLIKVPDATLIERVVKAVKKRKDKDRKFRALNSSDPCKLHVIRDPVNRKVTIFLRQTVGLANIVLPEDIEANLINVSEKDI